VRSDYLRRAEIRWSFSRPRAFLRAYFAHLDYARWAHWARQAAGVALSIVDPGVHEAVVSSGPPHMVHEAGRIVSLATGLPFVMDMRDPWSLQPILAEHIASPVWLRLAASYERKAARQADILVCVSETMRRAMIAAVPEAAARMITVTNGFDEDDDTVTRLAGPCRRFVVAYAGSLYGGRDPGCLLRAAAQLVRHLGLTPRQFGIELIGDATDSARASISNTAREERIEDFVSVTPRVSRSEARRRLAHAPLLVSLAVWDELTVPAKIYEYAQFEAWLLALAEPESATELALRGTGADVAAPTDVQAIAAILRERYLQHARGVRPARLAIDERLTRRAQAGVLFEALTDCLQQPGQKAARDCAHRSCRSRTCW
jgi:hypothetical protein